MANSISNLIPGIRAIPTAPGSGDTTKTSGGVDFGQALSQALDSVNQLQTNASQAGELLATGKIDDLHTVMMAGEKADIALQFTLQVRNKVIDAYNEIMRMPI